MNEPASHSQDRLGSRRILEIGELSIFGQLMPDRTDAYYTGYRADRHGGRPYFGFRALVQVIRKVRRGDYALAVILPPLYPFWSPRSFLAAFKFSVFRGKPFDLPGALISPFVFELLRLIPLPKMIAVERTDNFGLHPHQYFLLDRCERFYKRELPVDHWKTLYGSAHRRQPGFTFRMKKRWQRRIAKLAPIGIGIWPNAVQAACDAYGAKKETDVFFAGTIGGGPVVRDRVPAMIEEMRAAGINVDFPQERIPLEEFMHRCARAWITLSPEGLGWDCYRHVEASIAGSVPLINAPTIDRYKPLVVGEHCLAFFPDENRIVDVVREALADKDKLRAMSRAAHEHALANLTQEAILLELLRRHVT